MFPQLLQHSVNASFMKLEVVFGSDEDVVHIDY